MTDAQPATPARTLSPGARLLGKTLLLLPAVILVVVIVVLIVRQQVGYSIDQLSFYEGSLPLSQDIGTAKNYNAWCDPSGRLVTSGPPPWPCAIMNPFKTTTGEIRLELDVSYSKNRRWSDNVPFTCTVADAQGRTVATAQGTGAVPNAMYPRLTTAWWLAEFDRPASSWAPGRYVATCQTPRHSIRAWLDIAD